MKYILVTLFAALTALTLHAAGELQISLYPERVSVGDRVEFTLTIKGNGEPRINELPDLTNGRWLPNSTGRSYQNFNGNISVSYTIPILATHEGELIVPAFDVVIDGKTVRTTPGSVQVLPPSEKPVSSGNPEDGALTLDEAVFGRITVPDERRTFYVGEEIPLNLELYIRNGIQAQPTAYPEIGGLDNAVFRDYSAVNPEQRKFDRPYQRRATLDGTSYTAVIFPTAFQAVATGKLTPTARENVAIADENNQRRRRMPSMFDDDFFDSFFNQPRMTPYDIDFQPGPTLEIKPLPPPPAACHYLGLIGQWEIQAGFDRDSARVGEPVTLRIEAEGTGSPELLSAPKLEFPGFRAYPPEVKKAKAGTLNRIEIQYVLIPLREGEKSLELQLATFNPANGAYRTEKFSFTLPVAPGTAPAAAAVYSATDKDAAAAASRKSADAEPDAPAPVREELFYQKEHDAGDVAFPLYRNHLLWIVLAFLGGPAAAAILLHHDRKMRKLADDPAFAERRALLRQRGTLLRRLKTETSQDSLREMIHQQALPMLAEYHHLPHGASAGEIAAHVEDPDLRELLTNLESSSFQYGGGTGTTPISAAQTGALRRTLKKLSLFLALSALPLFQLGAAQPERDPLAAGNDAFAAGEFDAAEKAYLNMAGKSAVNAADPHLLYNLGCVYYQKGNLPLARYCFSRAHLLAPRDSETLENLNLVNRKLLQSEEGSTATPLELATWCRDRFRPDEYLLIAALAWAALWVAIGCRNHLSKGTFRTTATVAACVLLLALAAAFSQMRGPYSSTRAVVIGKDLSLRSLPTAASGKIEVTVPGGSSARILDTRDGWVRVEVNGRDGWAPSDRVKSIIPEGLF